ASLQSSQNFEKHSENFSWRENHYEANRRRHNSTDGFDPGIGRPNGGHFGRKEKHGWRSQGRSGTESINHRGGYHGGGSRTRTSAFHWGRGRGLRENNVPDKEAGKKEDKEVPRQFKAEDFPSLNPKYEREPNQNKSLAAGVWDYPLNPKSRSPRMLVVKKGSTKELQIPRFPVVGSLHSQPVRKGTGTSVYKGLVPKPVTPPTKPTQWSSEAKENYHGNRFSHESAYGVGNFRPFKSAAKAFTVSQKSVEECNRSNSSSPVDKVGQPNLTKWTRMRTDKKSEFLKALKQDRVEKEHEDKNRAGQEKNDESFNLNNTNSPHHERDINQNFESEIPQENGNTSVTSQQIVPSSAFPQADVLSSSLEAEHRLLKEMGWQEYSENDETCAPLTEDEMREFRVIREQLQKNGFRKTGILKNSLICGSKFSLWKNSTFRPALEKEDSETSSSDTSDDDDL
ncbi:GPBP1 protein, partial [Hemiprocne comata]|nr:GPBP1 protein [Hemiprocne comata]